MQNIKLIVTDIDNTLLRSDKSISEYTADIFKLCRERGIKIAVATARSESACRRVAEIIKPDAIVSSGGALVRVDDKSIYNAAMSAEITSALMLAYINLPDIKYMSVDTPKGHFVNKPVDPNDPSWADYLPVYQVDFSQGLDCGAYKISAEISDDKMAYALASEFPTVAVTPFSGENWFAFADKAASKFNGVSALAEYFNIDAQDIIAFGDDYNDIEMLRGCGVGVAVANAIDEVKAAADDICDTNDNDGAAKWLASNIIK